MYSVPLTFNVAAGFAGGLFFYVSRSDLLHGQKQPGSVKRKLCGFCTEYGYVLCTDNVPRCFLRDIWA